MMKNALISVHDKSNLIPFAQFLVANEWNIFATGQTAKFLKSNNIKVSLVEDLTMFPELMDGRIKTLHPKIFGAILGLRDNEIHQNQAKTHDIPWIDLVVVNLYPFKETVLNTRSTDDQIIEQIDIGGSALIRSAAKNHAFVGVVIDPKDYQAVIDELNKSNELSVFLKRSFAAKAFRYSAQYDAHIAKYLTTEMFPERLTMSFDNHEMLRYGENPHQKAALYKKSFTDALGIFNLEMIQGKPLSYNNLQDINAAVDVINSFGEPTAITLKHTNPCGVASGKSILEAFEKAYLADPISIFGGIVAFNNEVDDVLAEKLNKLFLEVVIAPSYTESAISILSHKRNVRVMKQCVPIIKDRFEIHSIEGGILIQEQDIASNENIIIPTKTKPTPIDLAELHFCMKIVKHVKSNAIVVGNNHMTLGIGAGQMNRVGAAKIALEAAGENAKGAYLASDGFLPMTDTVELASKYGIKAIIQPGGSIKDQDSIDLCDEKGIIMVITNTRHFKH
jgi:phosphoribosylaminoimidazolecarboxamide formyltransferase / IMP cyclohydrolase